MLCYPKVPLNWVRILNITINNTIRKKDARDEKFIIMVFLIIFKSDCYKKFCNSFLSFLLKIQVKIVVYNDTRSSKKAKDVTNKETRTAVDHEKKSMSSFWWWKCVEKCVID